MQPSAPRKGAQPAHRLLRRLVKFRDDRDGATAVEFALVSVPFLGLLFAIFESAFVFFASQGLDAAVSDAARSILTGQAQANAAITTAQQFRDQMICSPTARVRTLPSFIDCSQLLVDVRPASSNGTTSFAAADTTKDFITAASQTYCTGGPNDVVVVRVVYPMPVYLSIVTTGSIVASGTSTAGQTNWNGKMVHMIMGISAFRNEPFPNYAGPVAGC